jgi:hypothetical protein
VQFWGLVEQGGSIYISTGSLSAWNTTFVNNAVRRLIVPSLLLVSTRLTDGVRWLLPSPVPGVVAAYDSGGIGEFAGMCQPRKTFADGPFGGGGSKGVPFIYRKSARIPSFVAATSRVTPRGWVFARECSSVAY